jgi:hypothetical protein
MPDDRRGLANRDSGRRRRSSDPEADFNLLRDRIILGVGVVIVIVVTGSAIFLPIRDPELALAALTLGGALLGVPSVLRFDELRRSRNR